MTRLGGAWLGRRGEPGNEANVPHILIHDSKAVDLELNLLVYTYNQIIMTLDCDHSL